MIAKRKLLKNLLVAVMLLFLAEISGEARPALSSTKICFDMILPRDLNRPVRELSLGDPSRAIIVIRKLWPNGIVLRVKFLGGNPTQHALVRKFANQWSNHANIKFAFVDATDAEIRISFTPGPSWSYVGNDSLGVPVKNATMNLGWVDQGIVLHEFGHALGLGHEHRPPDGGIKWNGEVITQELIEPPTFWTGKQIEKLVLKKYGQDLINGTEFDPDSIMRFRIPQTWTLDGFHTEFNTTLSEGDKAFIGGELGYPRPE